MNAQALSPGGVASSALVVFALAATNWIYAPGDAVIWGGVMALALAGAAATLFMARSTGAPAEAKALNIRRGVLGGSMILSMVLALSLAGELGLIGAGFEKRTGGVFIGAVLIIAGNFLPKTVRPLTAGRCEPAKVKAAERFAGWTFVLAGAVTIMVWAFAPLDDAKLISSLAGLSAFGVAVGNCAWLALGARLARPTRNQHETY